MKIEFDSDLNFGDTIYVCSLYNQDNYGEIQLMPTVEKQTVTRIIANKDGTVWYNEEDCFKTLEEAKKFCEDYYFEHNRGELPGCGLEKVIFKWQEKESFREVKPEELEDTILYTLIEMIPDGEPRPLK